MNISSEQIAKLAGVSRSTVSKVLHNYPEIPEETKQKVLKIVNEYGYKPNSMSQALKGINPKVIGVYFLTRLDASIFERINSHYDTSMLSCITMEAKRRGYNVMYDVILPEDSDDTVVANINEAFSNHRICAAVFIGLDDKANFLDKIAQKGRHIIVLDKTFDTSSGIRCLYSNDYNSAIRACEHLYHNGFKRIMHLTGSLEKLSGQMRREGYMTAYNRLKQTYGLDYEPKIIESRFTIEHGYNSGRIFVEEKLYQQYDGIMCGCDMIAIGFMKYIREKRPDLIDKFGIIGFDNEPVDLYITPALSTMAPDYTNFARFIFDLEQNYDHFQGGISVKIEQDLIERDSSRPIDKRTFSDIPLNQYVEHHHPQNKDK